MDMYFNSPNPTTPPPSNSFIRTCSHLLSDESTRKLCDPCRGRHKVYASSKKAGREAVVAGGESEAADSITVNTWLGLNSNMNLEGHTSDSVREPLSVALTPSNQSQLATTVPVWTQSIDPRIFSTQVHLATSDATSELANALVMPSTAPQGVHGELQNQLPSQVASGSGLSQPITNPVDEGKQRCEELLEAEGSHGQMRVCSVRGCKHRVPEGYEYKMCPACRVRYQKYGTTKRAKWKVVRDKEKQAVSSVSEDPEDIQPDGAIEEATLDIPTEWDPTATSAQRPPKPSADELNPALIPPSILLPQMHQPPHRPTYSTASPSSAIPNPSFIQEQIPRPASNPSATGYLESDPIVNGFSKFRVELLEGELDVRHAEGTVMSASNVMTLGVSSKTNQRIGTDPSTSSVSFGRTLETSSSLNGEGNVKGASGMNSKEVPSPGNATPTSMTRPIVPVSLSVCHLASESERHAPSSPSLGQNDTQSQSTKDGPSCPLPATAVVIPRKRKANSKTKGASTTASTPRPRSPDTPVPPQLQLGYPTPHPYLYPYYPMYFPPYPGAYQYPYPPQMPFSAPPSSPSKTKKKKKPSQAPDVTRSMPMPMPPPGFAYPYSPGNSGVWTYPTQPHFPIPPPALPHQIPNSLPKGSTGVFPVEPASAPQPPAPPPGSGLYAIPAPYSVPALHQPSQDRSASVPSVPYVSGTQPYSGTPLSTLMPVPFFPSATVLSAGGSRKDKKAAEKDGTRGEMGREAYQIHAQKQPHLQMQFNYYHYGMGTSQSPTTPESHARRKRRKVDPQYREKLEIFRAQGKATANPDSAASSAPVQKAQGHSQPDLTASVPRYSPTPTAKEVDGGGTRDERVLQPTLRRCSKKGCMRSVPVDGNNSTICRKCKTKFKKMTERTKQRFHLVPQKTVCEILGK